MIDQTFLANITTFEDARVQYKFERRSENYEKEELNDIQSL